MPMPPSMRMRAVAPLSARVLRLEGESDAREKLSLWMGASATGRARLRAGLPTSWRVGDKAGSGHHGMTNDVAILRPPHRPPILIAAYLTDTSAEPTVRIAREVVSRAD